MNLLIVLIIFILLVTADKGLTVLNIKLTQKNLPEAVKDNPNQAEKNPLAKYFFDKFGLYGGTGIYWIISLITLFIGFFVLKYFFNENIALYSIMIIYGFVLANNIFFVLKYSEWLN